MRRASLITKPSSCTSCPLAGSMQGWVGPDGSGSSGVLVVGEAGGADEAQSGLPFVGKAGYYLFSNLKRVGLERDQFRIHNCLSCTPPNNKLAGMSYESAAIGHCRPNLDATIADMQ